MKARNVRRMSARKHPAVSSARDAIQRYCKRMRPVNLFRVAALAELAATGKNEARWDLSADRAAKHPEVFAKDGGRKRAAR